MFTTHINVEVSTENTTNLREEKKKFLLRIRQIKLPYLYVLLFCVSPVPWKGRRKYLHQEYMQLGIEL